MEARGSEAQREAELAAKRAEIAAKVAAARAQQQQDEAAANGGGKKKVLSNKEKLKAALEIDEPSGSRHGRQVLMSRKQKVKAATDEHKMPSVEQLRRNAREMSRNPEMVRRANPEMRNFTDAQIREHAKEMEKMASNPEMLQTMMKVQTMPEAEKKALNQLQEGLAGKVVRDDRWIADTIKLVKEQPETLKMLFKGRVGSDSPLSEGQLMGIIDHVVTCSDWLLTRVVKLINWGVGPGRQVYRRVDDATFGCAHYLMLALLLLVLFYVVRIVWYVLTLTFGLAMGGYRLLTGGNAAGSSSAAVEVDPLARSSAADHHAADATAPEPKILREEEQPFIDVEL